MHCEVIHKGTGKVFPVIVVYGFNEADERTELWLALVNISKRVTCAWIVMGDLNNVLNLEDRLGSSVNLRGGS